MQFPPVRRAALAVHIPLGLVLFSGGAAGLWRLVRLPINWQSALALLAVMTAAVGLPIVIGRLVALARGGYHIDSQALTIRWGADLEQVPLDDIIELRTGGGLSPWLRRRIGARSGWSRARFKTMDGLRVESFATSSGANLLMVVAASGALAISPSDLAGFVEAFSRFSAAISAEKLPAISSRPPTLSRDLLSSRFARAVVAATGPAAFGGAAPGSPFFTGFTFQPQAKPTKSEAVLRERVVAPEATTGGSDAYERPSLPCWMVPGGKGGGGDGGAK